MSMDSSLAFIALIFCVTAAFSLFLAVRGWAAGRKAGFDGRIVRWGTAAALLMTALLLFASLRERLELASPPTAFQGTPIALVTAGILAMAFVGFSGLC